MHPAIHLPRLFMLAVFLLPALGGCAPQAAEAPASEPERIEVAEDPAKVAAEPAKPVADPAGVAEGQASPWQMGPTSTAPAENFTAEEAESIRTHVVGGLPAYRHLLVRNAYVLDYDPRLRVARWAFYHVRPEYLDTPPREGVLGRNYVDDSVPDPVSTDEYTGLFHDPRYGFSRGHLVPYAIGGGDRDGDGRYAVKDLNGDRNFSRADLDAKGEPVPDDPDDFRTLAQLNLMTNIVAQHHEGINGPGGVWYELERFIQDDIVRGRGLNVWVIAGCIYAADAGEPQTWVGPERDIAVPAAFYKIVVLAPGALRGLRNDAGADAELMAASEGAPLVLAFLFPHLRESDGEIAPFLATVDEIEAASGLDFLADFPDPLEDALEREENRALFEALR